MTETFTEGITVAAVLGGRLECAGLDTFSARARSDTVPPSEHPAMATETGGAAAGGEQQYSLRWNDFHSSMVSSFRRLRDEEDFVDVTLACAGATFTAHKVVLSACSPYFRRLLKANPCQHPIVILRDVHDKDMESLLRFMYQGEVHIGQEQLKEFLRAAQLLQVRGLTDVPAPAPMTTLDQKASPSASSWTETGSGASREGREGGQQREGRRPRKPDDGPNNTPPPKRARSSDLTEQLLSVQGASPERLGTNGHELAMFGQPMDTSQNPHLSGISNNLSGDGEESSSDAGASDTEGETRAKQEPIDYDDPATMANTNGTLPHNFPGLLNLPGFPGLPGPSGIPDNYGATWPGGGDRAAPDERSERPSYAALANGEPARPACPECGKLYSNNSNLKQHILNVHAAHELAHSCPVCGKAFKTRQYMQIHMNSIHGGRLSRAGRRWATGRSVPCAAACTPQPPICASICSMCTRRPTATSGSLASTAARSAKPSTTSSTTNCKLTASASDRTLRDGAKPSDHRPSHSHRSARSTRSARSARGGDRRSARSQHRDIYCNRNRCAKDLREAKSERDCLSCRGATRVGKPGGCRRTQDLLRVRATDPRPCPKCGKIYRSAHTLRTHLEDKHTVCPGYRCVLCGTVAKSRNSLHSHMSRQHRGISTKDLPVLQMPTRFDPELASQLLAKAGVKVSPEQLRARASPTGPRRSDIKLDAKSAASESSSICGDNDNDDLSQSRYQDSIPVSPPHINNLANTTITKVPAVRAVTAKTVENLPHGLAGLKHDDFPPAYGGNSALLDTYLQYIGENMFAGMNAKLAHLNALHTDRKSYEEPSPQMGSLPPPPTNLAHQRYLKQMQRQYTENMSKPDIMRDSDEPLDLGKERQRNDSISETDTDKHDLTDKDNGKDYYKDYNEDDRRGNSEDPENNGQDDGDYSDEEHNKNS
ncbi:unnamed protein product [Spodoptera littoralis]|uniref:Protein abrupt-like n=1 Tax=Spodoptera littoralis TaxID=7109 RepID=A0A9P0IF05_SPOLI|nr:unnamed protein product [Spodoptera littoralis]CAH1644641.1 unnamed protein product [Spodoptera littoralis]